MEAGRKAWLVYSSGKGLQNLTLCSISDPRISYSIRIPEQVGAASWIRTVQHGWYIWENITSKFVSRLFLWNPHNLKIINLPPLNHYGDTFVNCILSSPPTSSNINHLWSIFLFSLNEPSIFYYQVGDEQWTKVCFYKDILRDLAMQGEVPLEEKNSYFYDPVYCSGCLYAGMRISLSHIMVMIELDGFKINCMPHYMLKYPPVSFQQYISHFLGSNNVLFRIDIFHDKNRITAVRVWKFDCSQKVWEKVESIKDRVFFISSLDTPFACQPINPETEGGRIYVALKDINFFYIYNIEDKSLVISPPFFNLPMTRSYSRWFIPDTGRMAGTLKEKTDEIRERKSTSVDSVHYSKDNNEIALPLDVVEMVAKYLIDVVDYFQFRATNRLFRQAAPPIQWRSSMSRFNDLSMSPLFVFSARDKVFTFVHPKHGMNNKYIINFPQGQYWGLNSEICYSKSGWLLLVAINSHFPTFFNPFTKKVLPLWYILKGIRNIGCVGLSHSPTSSECVIVELDQINGSFHPLTRAYVQFLWKQGRGQTSFEERKFRLYNISPVFHNGLFYFLSIKGKLAVLEATEENICWKEFEEPQAPCSNYSNNFLVECDGNILLVSEGYFGKWVRVFKFNDSTLTWTKVESLINYMLFVGNTSFSDVAKIPGMENKIYFLRFYDHCVLFFRNKQLPHIPK